MNQTNVIYSRVRLITYSQGSFRKTLVAPAMAPLASRQARVSQASVGTWPCSATRVSLAPQAEMSLDKLIVVSRLRSYSGARLSKHTSVQPTPRAGIAQLIRHSQSRHTGSAATGASACQVTYQWHSSATDPDDFASVGFLSSALLMQLAAYSRRAARHPHAGHDMSCARHTDKGNTTLVSIARRLWFM